MSVGSHTFKFGGDYNYLTTFQSFGFNQFGGFSFSTSDPNTVLKLMSTAPGQNRFDDPRVRYTLQIGNLIADYNMQQIAFYAQDQWRINNQFQINYGVRWEGQLNPDPVATNTAVVTAIQNTNFPNGQTFDPTPAARQHEPVDAAVRVYVHSVALQQQDRNPRAHGHFLCSQPDADLRRHEQQLPDPAG